MHLVHRDIYISAQLKTCNYYYIYSSVDSFKNLTNLIYDTYFIDRDHSYKCFIAIVRTLDTLQQNLFYMKFYLPKISKYIIFSILLTTLKLLVSTFYMKFV